MCYSSNSSITKGVCVNVHVFCATQKNLGLLEGDAQSGAFYEQFVRDFVGRHSGARVDVSRGVETMLGVKDAAEQSCLRSAACLADTGFNRVLVAKVKSALEGTPVANAAIVAAVERECCDARVFQDKAVRQKAIDREHVELAYTPLLQGGAHCDLRYGTLACPGTVVPGAIVASYGVRYKLYCAMLSRTLFINPQRRTKAVYAAVVAALDAVVAALRVGARLADAARAGRAAVAASEHAALLLPCLDPCFGFGVGIQVDGTKLRVAEDAPPDAVVRAGMAFNVQVVLRDVPREGGADAGTFSVLVSDTVLVGDTETTVLTTTKKRWKSVSYTLSDEDEEEDNDGSKGSKEHSKHDKHGKHGSSKHGGSKGDDGGSSSKKSKDKKSSKKHGKAEEGNEGEEGQEEGEYEEEEEEVEEIPRNGIEQRLRSKDEKTKSMLETEQREQHQKELGEELYEELRRKLRGEQGPSARAVASAQEDVTRVRAYRGLAQMPTSPFLLKVAVDPAHEAVLAPVFGMLVPFHIGTIKNVTSREDTLRINFITPVSPLGTGAGAAAFNEKLRDYRGLFVRELTYTVPDARELQETMLQIRELRKKFTAKLTDDVRGDDSTVQSAEVLRINRGEQVPILRDVFVVPSLVGKKAAGSLEAHSNGFRFTSTRGVTLDILHSNIKHLFFQTPEKEVIILIHFHLKTPVLVGKKKTKDVQFYSEVAEVSLSLDQRKTHYGDSEEIEEEQRERQMRQRYITLYENFVRRVQNMSPQIEFDIPFHELGFYGAPYRSSVFLQPTSHCLVNLTEFPPFVVCLEDVEIAFFERVSPGMVLKNFDLVFVFKDYARPVVRINSVPSDSLQGVKSWLNSVDIKYYEGPNPITWNKLLPHIQAHPDDFLDAGGWQMLDLNADDSDDDSDGSEEEDENFGESDISSGDDDDDDYSDDDSDASEGSASGGDDGDDDDEDEEDVVKVMSDDDEDDGGRDNDEDDDDDMEARNAQPPAKASRN